MGEGWHNYHVSWLKNSQNSNSNQTLSQHVFPWDYKAAELGDYKLNVTTFWIDMFAKIGWAWDLKEPSKELLRKTIEKHGKFREAIKWVACVNFETSFTKVMVAIQFTDMELMDTKVRWSPSQHQENQISAIKLSSNFQHLKVELFYYFILINLYLNFKFMASLKSNRTKSCQQQVNHRLTLLFLCQLLHNIMKFLFSFCKWFLNRCSILSWIFKLLNSYFIDDRNYSGKKIFKQMGFSFDRLFYVLYLTPRRLNKI